MDFTADITRYRCELLDSVVPFWERHGIDRECGGYHSCLDRDGSVYDPTKHMWMQWRMVYTFATLAASEHSRPQWLPLALHGYDFLTCHGRSETGDYFFALDRQGRPLLAPSSIYSEAFAAMGCAALYRLTCDPAHRAEAEAAMARYLARIPAAKGRWDKAMPDQPRRLSLGHYMILANLGTVLDECLGGDRYAGEVARASATVLGRFWNPDLGLLFENINPDGSFDLASIDGRHLNPGHGLEAMWFIMQQAERVGDRSAIASAAAITKRILARGWDQEHGGIFYFLDALDRPQAELTWNMKLWWVHNEAALAALFAYRLTGDAEHLAWFRRIEEWTWSRFPDREHGEWYAYLDRRGEPTSRLKGGRWKCFFHLPRYLLLAERQMRLLQASAVAGA